MRRRCDLMSCDHEMTFPEKGLNWLLVCPHCGHETRSQSEALFRIRFAGRALLTLTTTIVLLITTLVLQ